MKTELKSIQNPTYELTTEMTFEEAMDLRRLIAHMYLTNNAPGAQLFNRIYKALESQNISWDQKYLRIQDGGIRF